MASSSSATTTTLFSRLKPQYKQFPWATAIATVPFLIWTRDSLFSFYRVQGSSMEPTLKHGDIVFVRKSDWGVLTQALYHFVFPKNREEKETKRLQQGMKLKDEDDDDNDDLPIILDDDDDEKARLIRHEFMQGQKNSIQVSRLYETPPIALCGHVIVFKHPDSPFPKTEMCVKRVIALGGQWVQLLPPEKGGKSSLYSRRLQVVPPHTFHLEGDNVSASVPAMQVSKNLLVGIAEQIVWPPTRWQRLVRKPAYDSETGELRARWT